MSRNGIPPELRGLAKQAEAQDWVITRLSSGHYRWTPPQGEALVIGHAHATSDPRASKNAIAALRQAGLIMPDRRTGRMPAATA
jgi:hypothetical protein